MIATVIPGGLNAFHKLEERDKVHWHQLAIATIEKKCADSGKAAVVAGHFMFWPEGEETGRPVYTQNDLSTFAHLLYLDVPGELVAQLDDVGRSRPSVAAAHIRKWQQTEKAQQRRLCRQHGILSSLISPSPTLLNKVSTLLLDFKHHTESYNLTQAGTCLDKALITGRGQLETMLVMDADRMLAAEDTGALFWRGSPALGGQRTKIVR